MIKYTLFALMSLLAAAGQAQNISGSWSGLLNAGMAKLHLVFHLQKDAQGKDICFLDSPDQSVKGIPTQVLYISADSLSIAVPSIGAKYSGKLAGEDMHGTFEQMGMKFPLSLKQEDLTYHRPQHPKAPYPYLTEDICFTNRKDGVALAGTLSYPVGFEKEDKVPVVLMVNGSGPENRDCEIYEHKIFLVIADFLARNGIASLRYDDRAVGASTGENVAENTKVVADDAKAGLESLRKMPSFSKIGILGHSEGATVAFMLGAEKLPDFIVSMAGAGVKGDECLFAQFQKISELSGKPMKLTKEQYVQMALARLSSWLEYFF